MEYIDTNAIIETPETHDKGKDILTADQRREAYRNRLQKPQQERQLRLKDYLLAKRSYVRSLDEIPRRKRAEDTDLLCRYFNGDQYGYYDSYGLYTDDRQEGDFCYALPVIAGHIETAFIQMLKVHPIYEIEPDDKNDKTLKLMAGMCEDVGTKELDRLLAPLSHTELYNMILHGESYRIIGWEPHPTNPKTVRRPKVVKKVVELPGRRSCAQCHSSVPADSDNCPQCGSEEINTSAAGQTTQSGLDYELIKVGQNTLHIPHMLSIQRDMSAIEPDDSSFVVEYSYIDKHVAEWRFQSSIQPTTLGLPIEMQMRYDLERGSTQIDAIIGSARMIPPGRESGFARNTSDSATMLNRKQPLEVHYWDSVEYGQFLCTVDEALPEKLTDGREQIPAGTLLGDFFPDGVKVVFCGDTIIDMQPYMRRRKMTLSRYGRIAGTNAGAGLKKLMPLQDAMNDNFNLSQTIKHTVGHPLTILNGRWVDQLPSAGNVLRVNKPDLDDVSKAVRQFPGQGMDSRDGAQMVIDGAMQFIGGTNTVGGSGAVGAPDMNAISRTATGIAAMQEQAASRQSGPVDQRIQSDKELIFQILENIKEYSTDEQFAELARRYGPDVIKKFREVDLRNSLTINLKPNTEMPRSMALNQANYIAFGQAVGQILPMVEKMPWLMEFLSDMATSMGFPFSVGDTRKDRREAEYRLNVLHEIAEKSIAQPAPQPLEEANTLYQQMAEEFKPFMSAHDMNNELGQPPDDVDIPRIFMQHNPTFMDVYSDWLFGEQAKSASQAEVLCVIQMWLDCYKAHMQRQAVEMQMQAASQQMTNPQPPPQDTGKGDEAKSQAEQEQFDRERQAKAEDDQRQEESKQREHGRKMELQDQKTKAAKDIAREKSRPALDAETAKQLLAAAGGNKTRARSMAAQQGYQL